MLKEYSISYWQKMILYKTWIKNKFHQLPEAPGFSLV